MAQAAVPRHPLMRGGLPTFNVRAYPPRASVNINTEECPDAAANRRRPVYVGVDIGLQ